MTDDATASPASRTYLLVDGENIDATLGGSILERKPAPAERPRWERVLTAAGELWGQDPTGLFFLNASSGTLPYGFVQALSSLKYRVVPLRGPSGTKVVDVGIQRTLDAIRAQGAGDVVLASHDADFVPQLAALLDAGHRVAVQCFRELLSTQLEALVPRGLQVLDLEDDVRAFTVPLPRLRIIDLADFDPRAFL